MGNGYLAFILIKEVRGRLAERVESVDQNETEHMSERQKKIKKNLFILLFYYFLLIIFWFKYGVCFLFS